MKNRNGFKTVLAKLGLAVTLITSLAFAGTASAATYTWTGSGTDANWFNGGFGPYTSGNFSGSPTLITSSATNTFQFNNNTRTNNTINSSGPFQLQSITFGAGAGAFTINPTSGLNFEGSSGVITNNSANLQTFSNSGNVTVNTTTLTVNTGTAGILIQGTLLGNGTTLNKQGTGELRFNSTVAASNMLINTTAGTTTLDSAFTGTGLSVTNSGVLNVNGYVTGTVTAAGNSTVNMFSGAGGTITLKDSAVLNNNGQTLNNLTVQGGLVNQIGSATYSGPTSISGSYVNISGSAVTFSGPVTIGSGLQTFTNATITGTLTSTGGTTSGLQNTNGVQLQGGSLDFNNGSTNSSSPLQLDSGFVSIAGSGYGTLTNASQPTNLGAGLTLAMDINAAGSRDRLITSGGNLDWGGAGLAVNLTNSGTVANYTQWDMFDFATQSGDLGSITLGATDTYNGLTFATALSSTNYFDQKYGAGVWLSDWTSGGQRFIFSQSNGVLTVVPEPSTIVFAGIGAAMLGWHTWTRSRRKARMKLIEEHFRRVGEARGQA